MAGAAVRIARHPVKGFTPEPLERVRLNAREYFPCDRLYAVEDGPSGFDASAPAHISKQRFTVLAKIPKVARARTRYDEASATLSVEAAGCAPLDARLSEQEGRDAFAAWLTDFLGEDASGPLRVLAAPAGHRFMDHPQGYVSIINLASVREIAERAARPLDPLRFRANVYVEGWPAWVENAAPGQRVRVGQAEGRVFKTITRCLATHVDPTSGERDVDVTGTLFTAFNHLLCGVYVEIERGGDLALGDDVEFAP
ncbi:MAG TPA: MOSC N-terminal beta barrel domain-containing protein [Caulobacteraceae bacterium]|jgi:hypothetical protein|nr:MOSC N-terminal beta barrel domain-containing protein [Caulobacteraceae bacterium]